MRAIKQTLFSALVLAVLATAADAGDCGPITPSEDWKTSVDFPLDPFRGFSVGAGSGWVKFTIRACEPATVYFQNSTTFPFHHDFARNRLDPYLGISLNDFNDISLHAAGQELILGAVIFPPIAYDLGANFPHFNEYAIQLVRQDAYTESETIALLDAVRTAVNAEPGVLPLYFPTFEQQEAAQTYAPALQAAGFEVDSIARWTQGGACYSQGWALGELVSVPADQIDAAYLSGALRPEDILITDNIPAEVPFVAGIITTAPATPNSHVAILAGTFGVPFGFLDGTDADDAMALVGNRIILRVGGETFNTACSVKVLDVEGRLSEPMIADLLALKTTPALDITPVATFGGYTAPTDILTAADIRFFGGKAANFGILRRSIPDNSPVSMAISFDLWNEFMDQPYGANQETTLRQEIAGRLAPYAWTPDFAALSAELDGIRDLIKDTDTTHFTPQQQSAIFTALQDPQFAFDPARKIRFRSSTNVEDSDHFTGAGLYDSKSGCLMDDLDGDLAGPSHCDATDIDERGVFRAVRRVYASFYNDNAYLERLRHSIDESQVGMAILVHHSFPDEIELANGVATLTTGFSDRLTMVTQIGAVSVTNPEDGSIPEEVSVVQFGGNVYPDLVRPSNLVQIGATVMDWVANYEDLARHMYQAAAQFELESGLQDYLLDFEYKKVANEAPPRDLVVKQIRQIPVPDDAPTLTPVLVGTPMRFEAFQGEYGSPLGLHRLKSRLRLDTHTLELSDANLASTFYTDIDMQFFDGCSIQNLSDEMASLPAHAHTFAAQTTTDSWRITGVANPRTYTLTTGSVGLPRSLADGPVVCLSDLGYDGADLTLSVVHDRPVPEIDYQGQIVMTTTDAVRLAPVEEPTDGNGYQQRLITDGEGLTIDTRFFWANPPPAGVVAGFTYHLNRWDQTVITGLTTDPIVLRDWYAQTYRPGHHNFSEEFVFEPRLEPGLTDLQRAELEAAGVGLIHAAIGFATPRVTILRSGCSYCACEITGDGETDIADLLRFLLFWFAGDPRSDLNGDGQTSDVLDLLTFLECWFNASTGAPCP